MNGLNLTKLVYLFYDDDNNNNKENITSCKGNAEFVDCILSSL